jgi:hypothetical protein
MTTGIAMHVRKDWIRYLLNVSYVHLKEVHINLQLTKSGFTVFVLIGCPKCSSPTMPIISLILTQPDLSYDVSFATGKGQKYNAPMESAILQPILGVL